MGVSDAQRTQERQCATFFYIKDLPPAAERELEEFLRQLKKKYHL